MKISQGKKQRQSTVSGCCPTRAARAHRDHRPSHGRVDQLKRSTETKVRVPEPEVHLDHHRKIPTETLLQITITPIL